MLDGTVVQVDQPPVLPTAKLPIGVLAGLSRTTSTSPLTPPAAPEATRAWNWLDPVPKLMPEYFSQAPLDSWATWLPSTPVGLVSPAAAWTVAVPWCALKQSAEMLETAVVVQLVPPPEPPVAVAV